MAEVKKDSSLGDSCGSDGSLSKDLSHQAELNFVSQGVNLAFEDEILLESSELPQGEKYENENVVEFARPSSVDLSKEMEIAAKYIEATEMSDAMEQDCDSDDALMFCENCKGPITKMKKFDNTGKQFCSKQCADSQNKAQNLNEEKAENVVANRGMSPQLMTDLQDVLGNNQFGPKTSSPSGKETEEKERNNSLPPDFDWRKYRNMLVDQAAPASCFGKLSKGVKGLKPGMKLEALDKNDPCNYCIATVIDVMGHRVRIRYDGFGNDDSRDFWCNFQAEELFPIGWCAENSYPLQPPAGITSTLEDWKTFLTKTLTGALAAPMDLFKENENRLQPNVHSFQAGARVECIHPKRPSIICPGTVSRILGPYGYEITTEPLPHLPAHVFYGNTESTGIFEFGWTMKNGIDLALPAYVDGSGLSKDKYIASCKSRSAPPLDLYKKTTNNFKIDQKLEAVDLEEPSVIRVATVFNIVGRVLHLLFDGQRKFQYVDCESDDIYPIDWCMKTGHPLSTPYGLVYPTMADIAVEPEQMTEEAVNNGRSMTLPSFQNVLKKEEVNKKIRAKLDGSILSPSNENASQLSKDPERKTEEQDKVEETHCVFFNKSCLIGPYLDPEKVANMPEFTAFGKPPAAIKFALEHVIEATIAPMEAMDAIQEGFCPKLFSKGKRKILKKGLFRFDTKLRAGRFLKRLCKKLKSCEYFLSFDPAKDPCPLECQVSGTTSLESFMAMRGMKAKGTLIVKRGRPRKDEFELQKPESHNIGEFGSSKEEWPANIKHTLGMPVRVMVSRYS